jgi:hypothetical protein
MASKDKDPEPTGRIVHDERGNAVWKGASADSTSSMLRRLELPGLQVEGQEEMPLASRAAPAQSKPAPARAVGARATDVKQGYNPYDQHVAIRKPTTPKGPVGRPVQAVQPAQAAKPKT